MLKLRNENRFGDQQNSVIVSQFTNKFVCAAFSEQACIDLVAYDTIGY